MEQPDLNTLTLVETVPDGLTSAILYANDPQGNVWCARDWGKGPGRWSLYRKAEDVSWPTLSVQDVLNAHERAKPKQNDQGGTVSFS